MMLHSLCERESIIPEDVTCVKEIIMKLVAPSGPISPEPGDAEYFISLYELRQLFR